MRGLVLEKKKKIYIAVSVLVFIALLLVVTRFVRADENVNIKYRAHVAYNGWLDWKANGETAGTTGESRRMEAIRIKLEGDVSGDVVYQSYVRGTGWQDEVKNGDLSGTEGQSKPMEAIKIKLTGDIEQKYNILYRVHTKLDGWNEWVSNGAVAGSDTRGLRIEAIEIKLEKKENTENQTQDNSYENNRGQVTTLTEEEYKIYVCIIFAEAGAEPYEAKLGVANVILNRMYDSRYPNTLKEVIYQKSQFSPAGNGILAKRIAEYEAGKFTTTYHQECKKAADEALAGHNNVGDRIGFMTPSALERTMAGQYKDKWVVGKTAFFNTK